jgi:hypothetical protein
MEITSLGHNVRSALETELTVFDMGTKLDCSRLLVEAIVGTPPPAASVKFVSAHNPEMLKHIDTQMPVKQFPNIIFVMPSLGKLMAKT